MSDAGEDLESRATPYELIGGEPKLREMVVRFYALMDAEPALAGIRKLHKPSLDDATEKLFMFLSGWLGGGRNSTRRNTATPCCAPAT